METKTCLPLPVLAAILVAGVSLPNSLIAREGSVAVRTAVDRPLLATDGKESSVVVKIEVEGCEAPRRDRAPLNLAIVLDRSGSMSGAKLDQAKQAALLLVDQLDERDALSLVTYESEIQVIVPATRLGKRRGEIREHIKRIETGGSTALYGGVEEGSRQLREFFNRENINRVILISDGIANVGPSDNRSIADLGSRIAKEGLSVTTIGLGSDYNETLMTALAEASDANYYHVADVETLPEVFEKELGELQSIVARGIIIEIRCPEGVRPLRILGRPGELKSSSETIRFATVSSGQKREIYLECLVTPEALGKVNEIASVAVRYDDALAGAQVAAAPAPIVVGYSKDSTLVTKSVNQAIVAEAAIFSNAVETENAIRFADKGDAESSRRIFDVQISKLKEVQAAAPAPQAEALQSEIESISRAREELESDRLSSEQRKALSNGTWKLRNNKR